MQTQFITDDKPQDASEGRTFDRRHPLSGEVVTRAAAANVADAIGAIDSAAAFVTWSQTGPSELRNILLKMADVMEQRTSGLIEAMGHEVGAAAPRPSRPARVPRLSVNTRASRGRSPWAAPHARSCSHPRTPVRTGPESGR